MTDAGSGPADPWPPHHSLTGERLRAVRVSAGHDPDTMAEALGMREADDTAAERGDARLPAAKLPRPAEAVDAPLATVVAELCAADHDTAELLTLAEAYTRIPSPDRRDALLSMALVLETAGG